MLRRHVYVIGVFAGTAIALLLTPEPASAQLFQRLRNRFGQADTPRYYSPMPVNTTTSSGPIYFSDMPPSDGVMPATAAGMTSRPVYMTQDSTMVRPGRRLFRRGSEPMYVPMRGSAPMSVSDPAFRVPTGSAPLSVTDPAVTRTAFYPSEASNTALITVRVPANAEIMIDGNKMTQQGTQRQFVSPTLERGSTYSYEVQAKWTENGQEVNRTQKVEFQPGRQVSVDFLTPAPRQQ